MKTTVWAVLWVFSASVWAAGLPYGGGDGTDENPYQLWTAEHLNAMADTPADYDKSFILMADIDLADFVYDRAVIAPDLDTDVWGPQGPRFSGTLEGNGFTIDNLTILNRDAHYVALIGAAKPGAVVRNLHLNNVNIAGDVAVSGLVGDNFGRVEHCSVTGRVEGRHSVAGLVGFNNKGGVISDSQAVVLLTTSRKNAGSIGGLVGGNNHAEIRRSNATCTIVLNHCARQVGGLVGFNRSTAVIEDSYASCIIRTNDTHRIIAGGGLVGQNSGDILESATWNVDIRVRGSQIGGLVGRNQSTVARCYAHGRISAGKCSGGMAGVNAGYIVDSYCDVAVDGRGRVGGFSGINRYGIARSYSVGPVIAADQQPGGFVGQNTGTVKISYWDVEASGVADSAAGTPITTEEMIFSVMFPGWGDNSWVIAEGAARPRLIWEGTDGTPIQDEPATYSGGAGTPDDPFWITCIDQLGAIGDYPQDLTRSFILMADLDFEGQVFAGIGAGQGFSGTFDGNGHLLSNLKLSGQAEYTGLFPFIQQNGVVRNLHLHSVQAVGSRNLGAIAGRNEGLIETCTVENLVITCPETACGVGGLAGRNAGTIRDSLCSVELNVKASRSHHFGGLVGANMGRIERSFAAGRIESVGDSSRVFGGLVGYCGYMSVIENCFTAVDVISRGPNSRAFGGFAGSQGFRTRIINSLSVGQVLAGQNNRDFGGFIGVNGHCKVVDQTRISGCFWDVETSGMQTGAGQNRAPNAEPIGAATEMLRSEQIFRDEDWSLGCAQEPGIWHIEANAYPMLSSLLGEN